MAGTRPYLQTPDDAAAAPLSYIYPIGELLFPQLPMLLIQPSGPCASTGHYRWLSRLAHAISSRILYKAGGRMSCFNHQQSQHCFSCHLSASLFCWGYPTHPPAVYTVSFVSLCQRYKRTRGEITSRSLFGCSPTLTSVRASPYTWHIFPVFASWCSFLRL